MKNNLTKSKVLQIVGVSVLCAVLVLGAVLGVVFGMHHSTEDLNVSKDMSSDDIVVSATEENGIMLTSGVATTSADGTTTKTLTATVTPSESSRLGYTWSIAFKNPSSTWANGKAVTDYVTVTQDSSNKLKATVTYKKRFSEQILVSISCDIKPEVNAKATVDCYKELTGIDLSFTASNAVSVSCNGINDGYYQEEGYTEGYFTSAIYGYTEEFTFGEGTIEGNVSCKFSFDNPGMNEIGCSDKFDMKSKVESLGVFPDMIFVSCYYNGETISVYGLAYIALPTSFALDNTSLVF